MSVTAPVVDDYYTLFDIDAAADADTIRAGLKAARRKWRQMTGSPDKNRARTAEQRMEQIEAAETTLLDASSRAAYDRELTSARSAPAAAAPTAPEPVASGWGERAKAYYDAGDVRNAFLAAKKGTDADPAGLLAWFVYVWAATDLKRHEDADFASAELVHRMPGDPVPLEMRAGVLDGMGRYAEAERAFREAVALAPANPYYQGRVAWAMLDQGRVDEAVREAWTLVDRFPDDTFALKVLRAAAEYLRDRKRPKDALALAGSILGRFPGDSDAVLLVVLAVQDIEAAGDIQTAVAEAWRLHDSYPDDERAQRLMRYVIAGLRQRGLAREALAESRRLLGAHPGDEEVRAAFALSRIAEAETRLSPAGPRSHIILNKAQATYYDEAIREIEAMAPQDADVRRALAGMGEYHTAQTKTKVQLGLGTIILAIVAVILILVGLANIASGGFIWLLFGALLGWAFWGLAFRKQYQLNYKAADPANRTKGLR